MTPEILRVHITTIMEDRTLAEQVKLHRYAILARQYLDANKEKAGANLSALFDTWNNIMNELAARATHHLH